MASNALKSTARLRVTAQAMRKARSSQKATPSAKMARTAPRSEWPRKDQRISENMMLVSSLEMGENPWGEFQHKLRHRSVTFDTKGLIIFVT
jgi:hypothetical protein